MIFIGLKDNDPDIFEFLREIKKDKHLKVIPVVILASSSNQYQIIEGFGLGVAGYIIKPQDISELSGIVKNIMQYWNINKLPPAGE